MLDCITACLLCVAWNVRAYISAVIPAGVDLCNFGVAGKDEYGRAAGVEVIDPIDGTENEGLPLLNSSDTLRPPVDRPKPELYKPKLRCGSSWSAP